MKKVQVYLDHAATTPLEPAVLKAMLPYLTEEFGNPSALYSLGRRSGRAIAQATLDIARTLGCRPSEFVYTSSATEADNLALAGVARANKNKGDKIIISAVEHKGVSTICETLAKEGFEIIELPVNKFGIVNLDSLEQALDEQTILVSVTMADSETGTLQPIKAISNQLSAFKQKTKSEFPLLHTDATQGATYLDLNVKKLGVDLLTLSAHKLGGPKGIAGLYVRNGVRLAKPRSGTPNVAAIVGFSKALELNVKHRASNIVKVKKLRDQLEQGILKSIPKVVLNGHPKKRLPNFLNVSILDIEGEAMLLYLDELGISISTGSACDSESLEPSAVLVSHGNPYEFVHGSIRFTLGHRTTTREIRYVLQYLPGIVEKLRQISPLKLSIEERPEITSTRRPGWRPSRRLLKDRK